MVEVMLGSSLFFASGVTSFEAFIGGVVILSLIYWISKSGMRTSWQMKEAGAKAIILALAVLALGAVAGLLGYGK